MGSAEDWHIQRCESIKLLQYYIYGQTPDLPDHLGVTIEKDEEVFGGKASRQLFTLSCEHKGYPADLRVGLILPPKGGRFPVVIKNDAYRFDRQEVSDAKRRKQYADAPRDDVEMGVFGERLVVAMPSASLFARTGQMTRQSPGIGASTCSSLSVTGGPSPFGRGRSL